MSYESSMLQKLKMPTRTQVAEILLKTLFRYNGTVKEFGAGEEVVHEIADELGLLEEQRNAHLETIYRKENRVKRSLLWHRLLFRAADYLANSKLITRPTQTFSITKKREWMLTQEGFDKATKLLKIPSEYKEFLPTRYFELQKIVNKINTSPRPKDYNPFDENKKRIKRTFETPLRKKGFRISVLEAYDFRCSICGLKINSPDNLLWEVEAAHIVPNKSMGKDDIWNGIALCRLHHWAFDVGWYTITDNFDLHVSPKINSLTPELGIMDNYNFLESLKRNGHRIFLPINSAIYPHKNSLRWHQQNVFYK